MTETQLNEPSPGVREKTEGEEESNWSSTKGEQVRAKNTKKGAAGGKEKKVPDGVLGV